MITLDIEMNDEFLDSFHINRESIYGTVYESDTSDDENLQTVLDRLHAYNDDISAGT